jgi:hypothetical protein
MRYIRVIAFGIIGLVLGIGWFQLDTSGHFERWEKMPNPSSEILSLFSPGIVPDEYGNPQPCESSSPEFSFMSNTPKEIAGCVQKVDMAADASTRTVFVINENGELWTWSYFDYSYYYYAKRVFIPTIGFILGLLTAFLFNRRATKVEKLV